MTCFITSSSRIACILLDIRHGTGELTRTPMCDDIDMFKNIEMCNKVVKIETFNTLMKDVTLENGADLLIFVKALQQGSIILFEISQKLMSLKRRGNNDVGNMATYEEIVVGTSSIEQQKRNIIDVVIESNAKKNVESFDKLMKMKRKREEEKAIFDELAELLTDSKRVKHAAK